MLCVPRGWELRWQNNRIKFAGAISESENSNPKSNSNSQLDSIFVCLLKFHFDRISAFVWRERSRRFSRKMSHQFSNEIRVHNWFYCNVFLHVPFPNMFFVSFVINRCEEPKNSLHLYLYCLTFSNIIFCRDKENRFSNNCNQIEMQRGMSEIDFASFVGRSTTQEASSMQNVAESVSNFQTIFSQNHCTYSKHTHTHADTATDTPNSVNQRCIACLGNNQIKW